MIQSIKELKDRVTEELRVLDDDIHMTSDGITFYLPTGDLDDAKETIDADLRVLEEHDYEYLIKATI